MALTKVTSALTDLDGGITIDNITIDVAGNLQIDRNRFKFWLFDNSFF